jgi:hypothetical protein
MKKNYTVTELKKICKEKKIKNYSTMRKPELLLKALQDKEEAPEEHSKYTIKTLKELCRKKNIKGYSNYESLNYWKNVW